MMREHSCYENMPGAFCLMRADGSERIVRCNEMMLALFQCSTEKAFLELTGGCLRGMVIAEDYRQISAQLGVWQREKSADAHYLDFELCTSAAHVRRVDMYLRRIEQDGEAFWSICLMDANMRTLMHVPGAMDGLLPRGTFYQEALRQAHPALGNLAEIDFLPIKENAYPLAYVRSAPQEKLLVILNPSDRAVTLPWDRPLGPAVYALGGKIQKTENGLSVAPLSAGFYAID